MHGPTPLEQFDAIERAAQIEAPVRALFDEAHADYEARYLEPEQLAWDGIVARLLTVEPRIKLEDNIRYSRIKQPGRYRYDKERDYLLRPLVAQWDLATYRTYGDDVLTYNTHIELAADNASSETNDVSLSAARNTAVELLHNTRGSLTADQVHRLGMLGIQPEKQRHWGRTSLHLDRQAVLEKLVQFVLPAEHLWAKVTMESSKTGHELTDILATPAGYTTGAALEYVAPGHMKQLQPYSFQWFEEQVRESSIVWWHDDEDRLHEDRRSRPELSTMSALEALSRQGQANELRALKERQRYHDDLLLLSGLLEEALPLAA